jgi:hypothetical protein
VYWPLVRRILSILGRRRALPRVFASVLLLTMLASALPHATPARADNLCTLNPTLCPPPPTNFAPADLLDLGQPLYAATAAQVQSLENLEQAAVSNTIRDHGLPSSDANAAQSWGRDDAEAELWALLVQAIKTAPASRTTDQQNAVDWLTAIERRQGVQAADAAGLEYVKWAGLDQTQYQTDLTNTTSQSTLQSFLTDNTPTGYCSYRSPAPDQGEYTGYTTRAAHTHSARSRYDGHGWGGSDETPAGR